MQEVSEGEGEGSKNDLWRKSEARDQLEESRPRHCFTTLLSCSSSVVAHDTN